MPWSLLRNCLMVSKRFLGTRAFGSPVVSVKGWPLARAFIRDPQVLILDEATNSLDLISEGVVRMLSRAVRA